MATHEVEVQIRPWEDGGYIAEAVGLQGCWVTADTVDQAAEDIKEVIPMWIRATKKQGWSLPLGLEESERCFTIRFVVPAAVA